EVCNGTNYKCFRGDEQNFKSDIFPHILKFIVSSEIIIANITGRNANVFYELGIAHALNKKVILIAQSEIDHIPIDLQSKRILFYKDEIDLYKKLPLELLKV
ncbi:nucleoside 2-deoxyribosyltransferase, partial [Acinetobacter baumannii]|nr:nucleoside 2-deoxyribosyltransferase [Acinetobacter baumannii]